MTRPKRGYRRKVEIFDDIVWRADNAAAHLAKRPIPFALAVRLDWSDIVKRKDVQHRDLPERFNALARLAGGMAGDDFVFFVVYTKTDRLLNVISIRQANAEEREQFRRRDELP